MFFYTLEHYALYFKHLTVEEFREKLTESLKNNLDQIDGGGTGGGLVISGSSGIGGTGSNVTGGGYDGVIRLRNVHMTGPSGIRVKLTNNVIQNMKNESIYSCLVTKGDLMGIIIENIKLKFLFIISKFS